MELGSKVEKLAALKNKAEEAIGYFEEQGVFEKDKMTTKDNLMIRKIAYAYAEQSKWLLSILNEMEELEKKFIEQQGKNEVLEERIKALTRERDNIKDMLELTEYVGNIEEILRDNKGLINSRTKRKEGFNPAFRADIDTTELFQRYSNGESLKKIAEEKGCNENTLRERLKKAGLWKK